MSGWLIDGVSADHLPASDRGFQYGDGLFETIALRAGQARFLDAHRLRLEEGLSRLAIPSRVAGVAAAEVEQLANGVEFGIAKIIVTRGSGERGYRPPRDASPMRMVGVLPAAPAPAEHYAHGISMRYCKTPVNSNRVTAGIKSLERLAQVLARAEWDQPDIAEGAMLDEDGYVVCGTMTNIFYVHGNVLSTPSLECSGIAGVMRAKVLEEALAAGLKVQVRQFRPEELALADEVFVTNSQVGIWPVRRLAEAVFPVGPATRRLMARLVELGVSECAA